MELRHFKTNQFQALFNLAGREIAFDSLPPVTNKIIDDLIHWRNHQQMKVNRKFGILGEAEQQFVSDFAERHGSHWTRWWWCSNYS